MKKLLLHLSITAILIVFCYNLSSQTFTPLPVPHHPFIMSECEGDSLHYLLFREASMQNDTIYLYSFDGNTFASLDAFSIAPFGTAYCIGYHNNEIYIGGGFDTINGTILSSGLFKYSLSNKTITKADNIFTGGIRSVMVRDIKNWNGQLLMGGAFIDGVDFNPLVKGSGTSWSVFDQSVYSNGGPCLVSNMVEAIYPLDNSSFYIEGAFTKINQLTINSVAYYNNGQWTALGNGLPGNNLFSGKTNIAIQNGKVFVSYQDTAQLPTVSYFDGTEWSLLENKANTGLYDLLDHPCGLFVIKDEPGMPDNYNLYDNQLVRSDLPGVDIDRMKNVFNQNGSVYVFGDFEINSQPYGFGRVDCSPLSITEQETEGKESISPNPFSNQLTFSLADNVQTTVSLYNFLGQQVLQQAFTNSTTVNTEQLADGIYFYELRSNKGTLKTGKVVKQ